MAKASSPVRLQEGLMQAATVAGKQLHRSAAEQIEYWASLGRSISKTVDPDALLAISTGLATLKIEPVSAPYVDPDDVFASIERDRESGDISHRVADKSTLKYQSSTKHPGQLERIDAAGIITIGQFSMGKFTPKVN